MHCRKTTCRFPEIARNIRIHQTRAGYVSTNATISYDVLSSNNIYIYIYTRMTLSRHSFRLLLQRFRVCIMNAYGLVGPVPGVRNAPGRLVQSYPFERPLRNNVRCKRIVTPVRGLGIYFNVDVCTVRFHENVILNIFPKSNVSTVSTVKLRRCPF